MGSYQELVKKESTKFFEEHHPTFLGDADKFGATSDSPNFLKWLDRTAKLNTVVEDIVANWGLKDFHWVQSGTRNKAPQGGDPRSNSYGSFYSDIVHELKKLKKKAAPH